MKLRHPGDLLIWFVNAAGVEKAFFLNLMQSGFLHVTRGDVELKVFDDFFIPYSCFSINEFGEGKSKFYG